MSSSAKRFAALAALSLLIATILAAYTSHGLVGYDARALAAIDTATRFQFYHGLALLAVPRLSASRWLDGAAWAFVAGSVLVCGGIYLAFLAGWPAFNRLTPLGGLAFIGGWVAVLIGVLRTREAC